MPEPEVIVEQMTDEVLEAELNKEEVPEEKKEEPQPEPVPVPEPEPKVEETPKPAENPPEEEVVTLSKTEHEKLLKRIEEKEKFIQKQAQEVGQRRKSEEQLRTEIGQLQQRLSEVWTTDGVEATNIQEQIGIRKQQLSEAEQSERMEVIRNYVTERNIQPETYLDEMIDIIKEDGQPPEAIQAFRDNPYRTEAGILINLTKRAELKQALRQRDSEIASLKSEIQSLKTKPQEVVKHIERAMKQPAPMTNDSGQAQAVKREVDVTQIYAMSDADLEKALQDSLTNSS
jgi:chromosome segregation ATPase